MTALRERPRTEGGGEEKRSDTINYGVPALAKGARLQRNRRLLTKNPPDRAGDEDQAAAECREEFHALLSVMELASWIDLGSDSRLSAATGWEALHCATTSRAQP